MLMPLQTTDEPLMVPGVAGAAAVVTVNVCAVVLPQVLLAFTVIVPPVVVGVAVILLVVELPLQPLGNVQVYEVAPFTADTA